MTAPARKPDNRPNPTSAPDLPPNIASDVAELGFSPLEINFFLEGEKIMTEAAKAVEAAPTPEEASRWERLKKFVREHFPFIKTEVQKAIDETEKLKKQGVGDPPAMLTPKELSQADELIKKIKEAEKKPRIVKLSGTRGDQLAILSGMYEALAKQAENNKPVDQDALYKRLLSQGAEYLVDPETGKGLYTKMTDKENERLAELEGRNLSDADFRQIVDGKKPWDLNSLSRAMNMLRNNQLPGESDLEKARQDAAVDPEKKRANEIITDYFSFTDVPGLTEQQKEKMVENAKNTPGNADRAQAMDRMIKAHSKEDVEKRAAAAKVWLESLLKKLNIDPSKFSQSKSWAFQDMAMQYHFFEHPNLIGADEFAADPMVSEQKLEEIISRHLGWELYWQKTQKNNAAPLKELEADEAYPEIVELLGQAPEKTGTLSDRDLARLGQLVRKNLREHSTEEFDRGRSDLTMAQAEANFTNVSNELESLRDDIEIVHEIEDSFTPAARLLKIEDNLVMLGERVNMTTEQIKEIQNLDRTHDRVAKNEALAEVYKKAVELMTKEEGVAEARVEAAEADLSAAEERLATERAEEERRKKAAPNAKVIPFAPAKSPDTMSDAEREARIDAMMTSAHDYIGTKEQVEKLNKLDAVHLAVKKVDLEGADLDKLRAALCGEAGTGLKLEDAQLLEEDDLRLLAKELLDKINEAPDVRTANAKTSPAKPTPAPTKPATGPASPNVKNVDARSDEEKALVKKIIIEVDKKIAQAQRESLANLDKQDVDTLRKNIRMFTEVSDVDSFKKMLVDAKYLTEGEVNSLELNKLSDEDMELIREQIVRDIGEVLFVKNSTAKSGPKKAPAGAPTAAVAPDAKAEAERMRLRQEALAAAEKRIDAALAAKAADPKFTARKAENYVKGIEDIPERAGGAIGDRLFEGKYITAEERKVLIGGALAELRKKLLEGAKKLRDAKKAAPAATKPDTGATAPTLSEKEKHEKAIADISAAMEAWKNKLIADDNYTVEQAAFYLQTISHIQPTATFVLMNGMEKDGFIASAEQRSSLRSADVVALREKLMEEAKTVVDAKKSKPTTPPSKPPVAPVSGTAPTVKAPPRVTKAAKAAAPVSPPATSVPAPDKGPGEPDKEVERQAALQTADLAVNALNDTLTDLVNQERVTSEQLETNLKTLRENKDVLGFLEASLSGHSFRDLSDKLTADDLMAIQRDIDAVMQNHIRELTQKNVEDDPDEEAQRERDAQITDVNREIPAQIPKTLTQEQFDAVMAKFAEYTAEKKQKSPMTDSELKELKRKHRPLIRAAAGLK